MSYDSIFRPGLFDGQTIIVTGGGSGIGRCTAHELASLGAHVVLVGRKAEKLEKTAGEIVEDGGSVSWHACDIREEEAVKTLVANILDERGTIHHLVNNAGGQYPSPLASISQKGFETVLRTNLVGGFLVAREVFNQSMSKTGGSIVNMLADMWGGMPGMGHSGAARSGMENFTRTAAVEWGHAGVRVNAVAPGGTDAPPRRIPRNAAAQSEEERRWYRQIVEQTLDSSLMKRYGSIDEQVAAILFLASDEASYITGVTLPVAGGDLG